MTPFKAKTKEKHHIHMVINNNNDENNKKTILKIVITGIN